MRQIPKSRIKENQYTNGTGIGNNLTLRFVISKIPYIGFYNIINGSKYFTGKIYTDKSKPLEKYNLLKAAPGAIAAAGSIAIKADTPARNPSIRYFYKDLTAPNILIKEIDQNAYNQLAGSPSMTYQVISYNSATQNIDEVNKQMPGLREFLLS